MINILNAFVGVLCLLIVSAQQQVNALKLLQKINNRINQKQKIAQVYSSWRQRTIKNHNLSEWSIQLTEQSLLNENQDRIYQNIFEQLCDIPNASQSWIFQTQKDVYIAVNKQLKSEHKQRQIRSKGSQIYNKNCRLIAWYPQFTIRYVLVDREMALNGQIHLIGIDHTLISCNQNSNFQFFQMKTKLAIQDPVGAILRNQNSSPQILVAQRKGLIKVFTQAGQLRLMIKTERSAQLNHMIDSHPHPILISNNSWISLLDSTKYVQIGSNCPYLAGATKLAQGNMLQSTILSYGANKVYQLEIKQGRKRKCRIINTVNLNFESSNNAILMQKALLLGNSVYNLTEDKQYHISGCSFRSQFDSSIRKKTKQGYVSHSCCDQKGCKTQVFLVQKYNNYNPIIIIAVILLFILFLVPYKIFKRKSSQNPIFRNVTNLDQQVLGDLVYELNKSQAIKYQHKNKNSNKKKK